MKNSAAYAEPWSSEFLILRKELQSVRVDAESLCNETIYNELILGTYRDWSSFEKRLQGDSPSALIKIFKISNPNRSIIVQTYVQKELATTKCVQGWPKLYIANPLSEFSLTEKPDVYLQRVLHTLSNLYTLVWTKSGKYALEKISDVPAYKWNLGYRGSPERKNTVYRNGPGFPSFISRTKFHNQLIEILS